MPRRGKDGREVATADSRRVYLEGVLGEDAQRVDQSALRPSRAVLTAVGHGASTLARWAYLRARTDALTRRAIPVVVSIEDLIDQGYGELLDAEAAFLRRTHPALERREFIDAHDEDLVENFKDAADEAADEVLGHMTTALCREAIESRLRFEVVRSLATRPWELAIGGPAYRDLLGLTRASPQTFEEKREELSALYARMPMGYVPPADEEEQFLATLRMLAQPLVELSYAELIRELNNSCNVRTSLLLDLSATPMGRQYLGEAIPDGGEYLTNPYADALRHMARAIRHIEEAGSHGVTRLTNSAWPSLLDKTYVLSAPAWPTFLAEIKWQVDQGIPCSPYLPFDLFAVIANHYPSDDGDDGARRIERLAAVLDLRFIKLTERTAISTEMVLLEEAVRESIEGHRSIPFKVVVDDVGAGAPAASLLEQALPSAPTRVFLCHSSADKVHVRALYPRLVSDGFAPWFDEEDLLGGESWELEIRNAVRASDFVVVCLSDKSTTTSGYVHKEITQALDVAEQQPEGTIFVIPLRLEECEVPDRLRHLQWVDLFADGGYNRLRRSLERDR